MHTKNICCANALSVLSYADGTTYRNIFDRALREIIADPVGKELMTVLCAKLNRKFAVWNAIITGAGIYRNSILTGIIEFKKKSITKNNFVDILGNACDFIRHVLLPQRPNDVVRQTLATGLQFPFDSADDGKIYSQVRSVYSTSDDSSLNGELIEDAIAAIPHARMHNVYYGLFDASSTLSNVAKGIMNVLDRLLDTACKAREFDSTFEVMDFHKCCFVPSASGRSMICINFADYNSATCLSDGKYSVASYCDTFVVVEKVQKDLYQAIFHESDHFLHFVGGMRRKGGNETLKVIFGLVDAGGRQNSKLKKDDMYARNRMVSRWTNDEEFATILGIYINVGGDVFFDRLSNAGFMWSKNKNEKVRIWHVVTELLLLTTLEEQIMQDVLAFIESNL